MSDEDKERYKGSWKIMRLRPDKLANAKKTAESVWESIQNPVDPQDIIDVTEGLKDVFYRENQVLGKRAGVFDDDREQFDE